MSTASIISSVRIADKLVRQVAGIKPHERVLIIADTDTHPDIYNSLAAAARLVGADPTIAIQEVRGGGRSGCTPVIAQAIQGADVVFTATNVSVAHSPAIQEPLRDKKIRVCSMASAVSYEAFTKGGSAADTETVLALTDRVVKILDAGKTIRVRTKLGTDLTASIEGKRYLQDVTCRNPGELSTHPPGEAWGGPLEGTSEGVFVADAMLSSIGVLSAPITFRVRHGKVFSIEGGRDADRLKQLIAGIENSDNIAEIALGTNSMSGTAGPTSILDVKHTLGSVHVAIGDNILYGGNTHCKVHIDCVVLKATVEVDGVTVFEEGVVKI